MVSTPTPARRLIFEATIQLGHYAAGAGLLGCWPRPGRDSSPGPVAQTLEKRNLKLLSHPEWPLNPGHRVFGDIPALTVDHATDAVGVTQGVTADHADEIFMPLAPRLIVTLGPPDGARSIPDDEVDQYNQRQARAAQDYLIHRPGADFTASITAWRK